MVDMWRALGYDEDEINEFIASGTLNAFLIVGRSIGFIGHVLDEKRLAMPMYRHPMMCFMMFRKQKKSKVSFCLLSEAFGLWRHLTLHFL
jgi:citrate synthase